MLDVALRNLSFRYPGGFTMEGLTADFARSTHTAIVGPPGCGASTLLRLISGALRPAGGEILLGQRRVTEMKAAHRPLLSVTTELDVPGRWSVEHALVAAVRARSLDRTDRRRELMFAAEKYRLDSLLPRRIDTLSSSERVSLQIARIDLFRPALLLADRLLEGVAQSAEASMADDLYRMLRVHGTTVISVPAGRTELALTDQLLVLEAGRVVQMAAAAQVHHHPRSEAAALATGLADFIPVTIRGTTIESVIGSWDIDPPPFQGSGLAVTRPWHFEIAPAGAESDLIFGVEEAGFVGGRWLARGILSGGVSLRVELPSEAAVHKGRLLALRYDPRRFTLLERETPALAATVPTDALPSMRESR